MTKFLIFRRCPHKGHSSCADPQSSLPLSVSCTVAGRDNTLEDAMVVMPGKALEGEVEDTGTGKLLRRTHPRCRAALLSFNVVSKF